MYQVFCNIIALGLEEAVENGMFALPRASSEVEQQLLLKQEGKNTSQGIKQFIMNERTPLCDTRKILMTGRILENLRRLCAVGTCFCGICGF